MEAFEGLWRRRLMGQFSIIMIVRSSSGITLSIRNNNALSLWHFFAQWHSVCTAFNGVSNVSSTAELPVPCHRPHNNFDIQPRSRLNSHDAALMLVCTQSVFCISFHFALSPRLNALLLGSTWCRTAAATLYITQCIFTLHISRALWKSRCPTRSGLALHESPKGRISIP